MRNQMQKGMPSRAPRRSRDSDERGFTLVEVMVAVLILMTVVISFTYLLIDSLSTALLSKQREAAASLASDVVENARAIGVTSLTTTGGTCAVSSTTVFSTPPIATAPCFQNGYTASVQIDTTTYLINASAQGASAPVNVIVTVTWNHASKSYTSTSQVGV